MDVVPQLGMNIRQKIGTDESENLAIVHELVQRTKQHLRDKIDLGAVNANELKLAMKAHFDSALREYGEYRGDSEPFGKFKFVLVDELKKSFRNLPFELRNESSQHLSTARQSFRSRVDSRISSKCLPHELLDKILHDIKSDVIQECSRSTDANAEQLAERLDEEILIYLSKNKIRLANLNRKFESNLGNLISTYESSVEARLPDEDLEKADEQKLQSTFDFCKRKVFSQLNADMKFDVPETKEMFENRISNILSESFSKKIAISKSLKENKFATAKEVVVKTVNIYETVMAEAFNTITKEADLIELRKSKANDLIAGIIEKMYQNLDPAAAKEMVDHARMEMKKVYDKLQNERAAQTDEFLKNWKNELHSLCDTFSQEFSQLCHREILMDMPEVRAERENLISEFLSKINWLNGHNRSDLLETFKNDARQQLTIISQPILERHEKILQNNYEYQRLKMSECLNEFRMKMKDLEATSGLPTNTQLKAQNIGRETTDKFEILVYDITPRFAGATIILKGVLKSEISKMQEQLKMDIENRVHMMNAEASQLVTDCADNYKHLINAFLIAANFEKEKIFQIHNNLKARELLSLETNLRLTKYTGDVQEQQLKLENLIDKFYEAIMSTIEKQRIESNQKLESCHQNALAYYNQMCNKSLGNARTETELQNLHASLKEQAIAFWEESFPIQSLSDKLLPERRKFTNVVDSEFVQKTSPMWHKINTNIDRDARNAVEKIVAEYERRMNSALSAFEVNSDELILQKHQQYSDTARRSLNDVNRPSNISKKVYEDLLSSRLQNTLDYIRNQNAQKTDAVNERLSKELLQIKEMLRTDFLKLKEVPIVSSLIPYQNRANQIVVEFNIPDEMKQKFFSRSRTNLTETFHDLKSEWNNIQPDANLLQLSINNAVAEYNKEMDNRLSKVGQVFAYSAMKRCHVEAMEIVHQNFVKSVKQTSEAREQFKKAIEEVRKKFEYLNDLKAAQYGEATVGIDLGTTFSCVAIYKGDKVEIIPDREHHSNTVPSYVYYESATKTVVGHSAKDLSEINPMITIFDSKRLIGRKFDDSEIQKDITQWPFKVVRDPDTHREEPKIEVHGTTLHPEQVSAEILKHLKTNAELYLNRDVKDVVITVPAYFNDAQKRATKNAATLAGINVMEIINEPTSAAIAYSLNYNDGKKKNVLVFDLGGGTFDVSVLSMEDCIIDVQAVGGDNHLGGEDFDSNLVDFCIKKFNEATGLTIPKNVPSLLAAQSGAENETKKILESLRRLRRRCEQAKINLSKANSVRVIVVSIYKNHDLDVTVTVDDFNEMNKHLFQKCIQIVSETIESSKSKLSKDQIDEVVLGKQTIDNSI